VPTHLAQKFIAIPTDAYLLCCGVVLHGVELTFVQMETQTLAQEKLCGDCGQTKPIDQFRIGNSGRLDCWCRSCRTQRAAAWNAANRDRVNAAARARRAAKKVAAEPMKFCPNCKRSKPHSEFNTDPRRSDGLAGYCRQCKSMRDSNRYGNKKIHFKIRDASRRAKEFGVADTLTAEEAEAVLALQYGFCAACGEPGELGVDHIVPLSLGGPNAVENIQLLHQQCNRRKGVGTTDARLGAGLQLTAITFRANSVPTISRQFMPQADILRLFSDSSEEPEDYTAIGQTDAT
jgi:5-methylcytosine-specific restriction endonuclease McrA